MKNTPTALMAPTPSIVIMMLIAMLTRILLAAKYVRPSRNSVP
jgi:hypothetical protein